MTDFPRPLSDLLAEWRTAGYTLWDLHYTYEAGILAGEILCAQSREVDEMIPETTNPDTRPGSEGQREA